MALADRLAHPKPRRTGTRAAMDVWMDTLTEDDRTVVDEALRDHRWTSASLLAELKAEGGPDIAAPTFDGWRRSYVAR